jgi:hypothetical protein
VFYGYYIRNNIFADDDDFCAQLREGVSFNREFDTETLYFTPNHSQKYNNIRNYSNWYKYYNFEIVNVQQPYKNLLRHTLFKINPNIQSFWLKGDWFFEHNYTFYETEQPKCEFKNAAAADYDDDVDE